MSDLRAMQRLCGLMRKAVQDYEMIAPGDRVMVGVSGGKDSVALTIGLSMLRKYIGFDYEVVAVTLDPQFDHQPMDYSALAELFRQHGIPYEVRRTEIGPVVFEYRKEKNPCALCAKLRRGALHTAAQELGCNKIALGHHFSDVIETTVMGLFYGGQLQAMPPKLRSKNFPGMELIRPLYCVHEDAIIAWKNYNHLQFLQCACRFTEEREAAGDGVGRSKRQEIKFLLRELKKTNPNIEKSIFQGINGLQLDTFPGFKHRGVFHSFPELYNHPDWFAGETKTEEISEEL